MDAGSNVLSLEQLFNKNSDGWKYLNLECGSLWHSNNVNYMCAVVVVGVGAVEGDVVKSMVSS